MLEYQFVSYVRIVSSSHFLFFPLIFSLNTVSAHNPTFQYFMSIKITLSFSWLMCWNLDLTRACAMHVPIVPDFHLYLLSACKLHRISSTCPIADARPSVQWNDSNPGKGVFELTRDIYIHEDWTCSLTTHSSKKPNISTTKTTALIQKSISIDAQDMTHLQVNALYTSLDLYSNTIWR